MNLFELHGTEIITESKINDINTIKSKIESRLNSMKARTYVSDNVITFSTLKFYVPSGSLKDRRDSLRIIKEGCIDISKESQSLKISWTVKLDSLYFLALCGSIVSGIVASLSSDAVISVGIGIIYFLGIVFAGIVLIKVQLNGLINSSVYKKD
jgi:hypothetical protein